MIPPVIIPLSGREILSCLTKKSPLFLEKKLSQYFGRPVVLTFSGRTAMAALLRAAGLKKNAEIILPAYGCPGVATMLSDLGYYLKFVDINLKNYNLSFAELKKKISAKTKAIIAVSLFGNPFQIEELKKIIGQRKILLIEAAAQGWGGKYHGKKLGTILPTAFFSLAYGKMITTMEGGVIVVAERKLAERCRKIISAFPRQTGKMEWRRFFRLLVYYLLQNRFLYHLASFLLREGRFAGEININHWRWQFSPSQTKLGLSQLKKLDFFNQQRRNNVHFLRQNLKKIIHPVIPKNSQPVFLRYPVRFPDQETRNRIQKKLLKAGVRASITYPGQGNKYPNAQTAADTLLMLPCHPLVKEKDLVKMARIINENTLPKNF